MTSHVPVKSIFFSLSTAKHVIALLWPLNVAREFPDSTDQIFAVSSVDPIKVILKVNKKNFFC